MTTSGTRAGAAADPAGEQRLTELVRSLDLEQQVRLLTGADMWTTHGEPAVGLRPMVLSDGPSGVRGAIWDERDPSLNLPSATALSASWDPELAYRYGAGRRCRGDPQGCGRGARPHRQPAPQPAGRPALRGLLRGPAAHRRDRHRLRAGRAVGRVAACPKHYVANDFETERFTASVEVDERALRELYLAPFERAVRDGAPGR